MVWKFYDLDILAKPSSTQYGFNDSSGRFANQIEDGSFFNYRNTQCNGCTLHLMTLSFSNF